METTQKIIESTKKSIEDAQVIIGLLKHHPDVNVDEIPNALQMAYQHLNDAWSALNDNNDQLLPAQERPASSEQEPRGKKKCYPAFDVTMLVEELIEPFDRLGNFLAQIVDDSVPNAPETIGLTILSMSNGMRYKWEKFLKKMEEKDAANPGPGEIRASAFEM